MKHIILPVFAIATLIAGPAHGSKRCGTGEERPPRIVYADDAGRLTRLHGEDVGHGPTYGGPNRLYADQTQDNRRADAAVERFCRRHARQRTAHDRNVREDGSAASLSAPERLDRMEKMTAGMTEAAQSTKAAFMPLYSVLSAEQKKEADALAPAGFGWG